MTQDATIDLAEIRKLSDQLFQRLEQSGVGRIGVGNRHYWTIFADEAFSLDKEPEPVVGDVFDDLRDLRKDETSAGNGGDVIFWHALHHLSGLMMFLASADMKGELVASAAEGDGS